ncbi:hypothetical protein K1719_040236 [Acacia pycnantha]|nr:hypothetical protein K1719_040236 [Acacia pycnantha]
MIGKTLKIDRITAYSEKGGFARMCVEVDLQKPLLPGFCHFGEERRFVYEGLHLVCFTCGKYGHRMEQCTSQGPSQEPAGSAAEEPPVAAVVPEKAGKEEVMGELKGITITVLSITEPGPGPQQLNGPLGNMKGMEVDSVVTASDLGGPVVSDLVGGTLRPKESNGVVRPDSSLGIRGPDGYPSIQKPMVASIIVGPEHNKASGSVDLNARKCGYRYEYRG